MRRLIGLCLLLWAAAVAPEAKAQYYSWGSDPAAMRWHEMRTEDVRVIYPDTAAALAQHTLFTIRTVGPDIGYGFRHGPLRIPFVLHPENFQSNGLVMFLPKRVEFLTSPAVAGYSMPWYKQLVAHEYRHAVQYNNLNRGVVRGLSYVLGQQGSVVGLILMPLCAVEGDAVMMETAMSSFGRGLQPSFTIGYRAMGSDFERERSRRNVDKWFCGSYRDFVPDHYALGYQISSYAYDRYGENVWDKVAWFASRNPYMLATTRIALEKYYDTNMRTLFRATFDDLEQHWASLPETEDSSRPLTTMPEGNYTTYQWPLPLSDTTVLAVKSDYDRWSRFVRFDTRTGEEQVVCYTGQLSSRPALNGGRVWWTEYRRSLLFDERVNSQLCYMDLKDGVAHTYGGRRRVLYPTPTPRELAWVEYAPDGKFTVYAERDGEAQAVLRMPGLSEIHGLTWDDATQGYYLLVTDDSGMWIGRITPDGVEHVTEGAYITLSNLSAANGKLYFGSIESGRDEVHCYDLATRQEYRVTTSVYGSFASSAWTDGRLLLTAYDRHGYHVAEQQVEDSALIRVEPSRLPVNLVNPRRKRWEVVNLDSVHFTKSDSVQQTERFKPKRFRKVPHSINLHSWAPVAFNPFDAVDEHDVSLNLGATLLSQNLLSNTEAFASYGWNRNEGSLLNLGVRYFGLGVNFNLDVSYGGDQQFYALSTYDAEKEETIRQKLPKADKYHSVKLSAVLPLYFQRGYHTRQLSLSTGWNYSNGMVAKLDQIEWNGSQIANIGEIGFRKGLHKLTFGVGYSDQVRMAYRDLAPRWGYTLSTLYTVNPTNRDFSDLISFYGQVYLPGVAAHNSLKLAATYQTSVGGYKFASGYAPLNYKSKRLIPRGFKSAEIVSKDYTAASIDYQFPLCYPEGGIPSVVYIKRIRLNIGGDYAQFRQPAGAGLAWKRIWSVGGDVIFDLNVLRLPASGTSTLKLSFYRPSSGGLWWTASVGLPF